MGASSLNPETVLRLQAVLDGRKKRVSSIESLLERWGALELALKSICGDADAASRFLPGDLGALPEFVRALLEEQGELLGEIHEVTAALQRLGARFARETLNIGVSGQARVGKSRLLQTISGLSDDALPTGKGTPVTAVRSRLFHSSELAEARLSLHDYASFRSGVLQGYFTALCLGDAPRTPDSFAAWECPAKADLAPDRQSPTNVTLLNRLRAEHLSFGNYRRFLTGGVEVVQLNDGDLRRWIAYPEDGPTALDASIERRYMAVREAEIYCAFQIGGVERLGLVDLPGLGEVAPDAEDHHVEGLRNDVDFLVLVKRPGLEKGMWEDKDSKALDLLRLRVGAEFSTEGDFVWIAANTGSTDEEVAEKLLRSIQNDVNGGRADSVYRCVECDAASTASVEGDLLAPVFDHLARRLGTMDSELVTAVARDGRAVLGRLRLRAADLARAVEELRGETSTRARVDEKAEELRDELGYDIMRLVGALFDEARDDSEDRGFIDALEAAFSGIEAWADAGLGSPTQEAWVEKALKRIVVDDGPQKFALEELNRVRVDLSLRFRGLDDHLRHREIELWERVAQIFDRHLGNLLADLGPREAIETFRELLDESDEPSSTLVESLDELLQIRLDYRTQFHPQVREALDSLNWERLHRQEGGFAGTLQFTKDERGAHELFTELHSAALQAASETRRRLALHFNKLPVKVLHAAAEQFADHFLRARQARHEFRALCHAYRDEIWPGEFEGIDMNNARIRRLRGGLREFVAAIEALEAAESNGVADA